jgi:prepilin-type N-terminal cleavage/methylation domain-containing protein
MDAPGHKGFTLLELLVAMSITTVVAVATAPVAVALSHAHSRSDVMTESIQSARAAMLSMEATIRRARLVTGADAERVVLWLGDAYEDKQINLDELVVIRYLPDGDTVEHLQVIFPEGMPAETLSALNVTRTLAQAGDPGAVLDLMSQTIYADYLSTRILATGVEDFQAVMDAAPPFSRIALLRLTVGPPDQRIKLTDAARLRADAVDSVATVEGVPVLNLE